MPDLLNCLLLSTMVLGALWLLYHVALRPERCFGYNRWFLLLAPVVAAGLPLLRLPMPVLWSGPVAQTLVPAFLLPAVRVGAAAEATAGTNWLLVAYGAGVVALLARLGWQLGRQWRFTRALPAERRPGYTLRLTGGRHPTGSFARTVYWDQTAPLTSAEAAQVLAHELAHVRQGHTYDRLWLELARAILWFNPFAHLLPRALHLTHEYLADAAAAQAAPTGYAALLARQAADQLGFPSRLTTAFHTSSILTRIAMLHHSSAPHRWKQWLALPLGALLLVVVACEKAADKAALPEPQAAQSSTVFTPPVIKADSVAENPADRVYTSVEQMPEYPGGLPKLMADIGENLHYPPTALAAGLERTVFVSFIVGKKGTIEKVQLGKTVGNIKEGEDAVVAVETITTKGGQLDVQVSPSQAKAGEAMYEEALRVVRELPGVWRPGKQHGQLVRVSFTLPIDFVLQQTNQVELPLKPSFITHSAH